MDNQKKDYRKQYDVSTASELPLASAAAIEVDPVNDVELIEIDLTEDATLNLAADAVRNPGQRAILKVSSDGTARDLTFGTNFTAPVLAGVINKTKVQEFVWFSGSGFVAVAAPVQID